MFQYNLDSSWFSRDEFNAKSNIQSDKRTRGEFAFAFVDLHSDVIRLLFREHPSKVDGSFDSRYHLTRALAITLPITNQKEINHQFKPDQRISWVQIGLYLRSYLVMRFNKLLMIKYKIKTAVLYDTQTFSDERKTWACVAESNDCCSFCLFVDLRIAYTDKKVLWNSHN